MTNLGVKWGENWLRILEGSGGLVGSCGFKVLWRIEVMVGTNQRYSGT